MTVGAGPITGPLTVLAAWPILGETPPALALAGGLVALGGVAVTRRR